MRSNLLNGQSRNSSWQKRVGGLRQAGLGPHPQDGFGLTPGYPGADENRRLGGQAADRRAHGGGGEGVGRPSAFGKRKRLAL